MKKINVFLLLIVFVVTGCALSPQIIEIDPVIKVDSAAAKPYRLSLDVVDTRGTDIIGKRGGVYEETSDITTSGNMTQNIYHNVSKALQNLGYQVAGKGESSDAELVIKVTNISYAMYTEKLLNKVEIKAAVEIVARKNYKEFTGGFNATRKKDFVKIPGIEQNEEIVNETLALVLQNMLGDEDLNRFLGG